MSNNEDTKSLVNKPTEFKGKKEDVQPFINSLKIYFGANTRHFPDDHSKILCALSYMKEGASTFVDRILQESETSTFQWGTFAEFAKRITNTFGTRESSLDAAVALEALRWTNGTDFANSCRVLASRTTLEDTALQLMINRKIPRPIAQHIFASTTIPDKWGTLLDLVVQLDTQYKTFSALRGAPRNPQRNRAIRDSPDQINRIDRPPIARLTPQERERCRTNNLCFRCRQPGHLAKNCRNNSSINSINTPRRQPTNRIREVQEEIKGNDDGPDTAEHSQNINTIRTAPAQERASFLEDLVGDF